MNQRARTTAAVLNKRSDADKHERTYYIKREGLKRERERARPLLLNFQIGGTLSGRDVTLCTAVQTFTQTPLIARVSCNRTLHCRPAQNITSGLIGRNPRG